MRLKVRKTIPEAKLPTKGTPGSACWDVYSTKTKFLGVGECYSFGTGLQFEVPEGYELEIRPRSGLARDMGIIIVNSPGTLDSDYRGELMIPLMNISPSSVVISIGSRIAQIKLNEVIPIEFEEVTLLSKTERGEGLLLRHYYFHIEYYFYFKIFLYFY